MPRCARCGLDNEPNAKFCLGCGVKFGVAPTPPPYFPPLPARVKSNKQPVLLLTVAAIVLGLGIGGLVAYRFFKPPVAPLSEPQATVSAPSPVETAPAPDRPSEPPVEPVPQPVKPEKSIAKPITKPVARPPLPRPEPASDPAPISPPPPPQDAAAANPPATAPAASSPVTPPPVRAIQEPGSTAVPDVPPPPPTPAPQRNPRLSQRPSAPPYSGPTSGIAVWTGRLDKNEALTITGGTASTGVISGAPLPGVPITIQIDESNLGFGEMPSAANGWQRLVLKSHAKHTRITLRWTVVGGTR